MNVLVIDHKDEHGNRRGASLSALIEGCGYKSKHVLNVWGDDEKAQTTWSDRAESIVHDADLVFLHVQNRFAEGFARQFCQNKHLVFYSGGGLLGYKPSYINDPPQVEYRQHCVFIRVVPMDAQAEWDLKGCIEVVEAGGTDFCERLHAFDRVLEAKLNLLYAMLDEDMKVEYEGNNWSLICGSLEGKKLESKKADLLRLAESVNGKTGTERLECLRKIRDLLLGE